MSSIKRALISLSDKTKLGLLASFLSQEGVEILSTGGTLQALQAQGLKATSIASYTGFPEILDGRVKTLHPKVHGALLGQTDIALHRQAMRDHGIEAIDLLVVNLYPFGQCIAQEGHSLEEAVEQIDIGGPAMLRAAAKNYKHKLVICDPADYEAFIQEYKQNNKSISLSRRLEMASKAFSHTASYDSMIASYLQEYRGEKLPNTLHLSLQKAQSLRYGENPSKKRLCIFLRIKSRLSARDFGNKNRAKNYLTTTS